jgi:hypothetical protein
MAIMDFFPQFKDNTQDVSGVPTNDEMAKLELQRKLKIADALKNAQTPQGQMISGHYEAPSWTQSLANAYGTYKGKKSEEEALKGYGEYNKAKEQRMADALKQYEQDIAPRTEQAPQQPTTIQGSTGEISPNMGMVNAPPRITPATAGDRYSALLKFGATTQNPELTQKAMFGNIEHLNKAEDRAADQEFERIMNKDKQGFELTQQEKQFANQMTLQKSNQQFQANEGMLNRKNQYNLQAPVSVMGPNGKPMYVERNKAIGMQPYTAAQEAKDVAKVRGGESFDTMIGGLRDSYKQLGEMGGITSTKQGPLSNLGAGIASSGIGQATGRLFGTQAQSIRNNIAQSRPLLLNAIKEATGMSAKQMDSNTELNLYLRAATDPALDLQANLHALDQLEKLYGGNRSSNQPTDNKQMSDDDLISKYTK